MNKKSLLSLCLFGATTLLSFATIHIMSLFTISKWVGVSVGLSLFVVMAILLLIATNNKKIKKHIKAVRYVVLTVNAIADGLAISSLFTYLGYFPEVWHSAVVAAALIAVFALYLAVTYIPFTRKHYIISMIIYVSVIIGLCIAWCVVASQSTQAAAYLAMLYMIVFIAFFITLAVGAHNSDEHIKNITYASFVGIAVAIIVLMIISESGDFPLDGLGGGADTTRSRKKNPYNFIPYNSLYSCAATDAMINTAANSAEHDDPPPTTPA